MLKVFLRCGVLLSLFVLAACGGSPAATRVKQVLDDYTVEEFRVCRHYGCKQEVRVGLNESDWATITNQMQPIATSPADERERVRTTIATFELVLGERAGVAEDLSRAALISGNTKGQQDCIDEAVNTTVYLTFLERAGLLQYHSVGKPQRRGYFVDGWPHNTAILVEHGTRTAYVVDSWFHGNGVLPEVVPLELWMSGWKPEDRKPPVPWEVREAEAGAQASD